MKFIYTLLLYAVLAIPNTLLWNWLIGVSFEGVGIIGFIIAITTNTWLMSVAGEIVEDYYR
jgi:hypothetical protein